MSKNIIQTIGQHVFKYDPPLFTEENVPVLAGNSKSADNVMQGNGNDRDKYQFLGEGYYFWDDNIERAHKWGKTRCEDKYLVFKDIIKHIDHFFETADNKALAEVMAAAAVQIEGDITVKEYLSGFGNEYFYTVDYSSNSYVSVNLQIRSTDTKYIESEFESASSNYGENDLNVALNVDSNYKDEVTKMIKKAA